jgi:hypothetical protein
LSRFSDDIYSQHHDFHFLDGDEVYFRHSATPMVYARASGILHICESKSNGEELRRSQRETFPRLAGAIKLAVDAGVLAKGSGVFVITGDYPYDAGVLVQCVRPAAASGHDWSSFTSFYMAEKQMTRAEFITFFRCRR